MPIKRGDDLAYALLSAGSATGSAVAVKGGEYIFMAEGTVGGATVTLQIQNPNGNWATVAVFSGSLVSFTSLPAAQTGIVLPAGNVRCGISGGSPSGISAWLVGTG
ncbi:MAG: hypothetical protein RI949_833 [Pseudomonadota bacterium]|jgi:hypothetical protein